MTPPLPSPLSSNAVVPTNGGLYTLVSLGYNHWLNLAASYTYDGNQILAWIEALPIPNNEIASVIFKRINDYAYHWND